MQEKLNQTHHNTKKLMVIIIVLATTTLASLAATIIVLFARNDTPGIEVKEVEKVIEVAVTPTTELSQNEINPTDYADIMKFQQEEWTSYKSKILKTTFTYPPNWSVSEEYLRQEYGDDESHSNLDVQTKISYKDVTIELFYYPDTGVEECGFADTGVDPNNLSFVVHINDGSYYEFGNNRITYRRMMRDPSSNYLKDYTSYWFCEKTPTEKYFWEISSSDNSFKSYQIPNELVSNELLAYMDQILTTLEE
jgi:hypothetical protein